MKTFKPMLASKITDVSKLRFPVLASKKLDGIRATVQGGQLLSRTLKPIPNVHVQAMFKGLPDGIDGELIYGDPCAPDAYRQTEHIVMSDDNPADGIRYHVFDKYCNWGFGMRLGSATTIIKACAKEGMPVVAVEHVTVNSAEELESLEAEWLADGHEGVMVRALDGPYKCGRSTEREGYLLKLKRFADMECEVVGTYELMHNDNEAFTNELGRTARSSCKDGKVGMDTLGGLELIGGEDYAGVQFRCGTGFDAALRASLWATRSKLIGRIAKVKYFPSGAKDKPRHPVFLGWRDKRDM